MLHTPALLKEGIHTHFKTCSFERGQNFECRGVMLKYSRQQSNHSRRTFKKCLGSPDFDRPGEYIGGVYLVILSIYGSQEKRGKKKKEKKKKKRSQLLEVIFSGAFGKKSILSSAFLRFILKVHLSSAF